MATSFLGNSTEGEAGADPFRGKAVGQLPPLPWLAHPDTRTVIEALSRAGAEVRFVGGCVRDGVLGRPVHDIDIATPDPPQTIIAHLEAAGLRAVPTGIEHGTVTAVTKSRSFEITTLRKDVETFGRHARVAFTDDWQEDAARRDFTFNAMSATPDGMIYDPFEGLADLAAGRVRFIGDPMRRIDEDKLRILRFYRFFAHYGRPPVDLFALAATRLRAAGLAELSGERVRAELLKLLAAPNPAYTLVLMHGEQVLAPILPEATDFGPLRQLTFLESRGLVHPLVGPDPLRRLAALLPKDGADAASVARRLRLSNKEAERLVRMAAGGETPTPDWTPPQARRRLYQAGAALFRDRMLLAWARRRSVEAKPAKGESARWLALLETAEAWEPRQLPIGGQDVVDLGVPPGPLVGQLLGEIEAWWIEGDFKAGREDALKRLRVLVSAPA